MTKKAFILNNADMPAKQVVALAEKQGIRLTVAHVNTVRWSSRNERGSARGNGHSNGRSVDAIIRKFAEDIAAAAREEAIAEVRRALGVK